MLLKTFKICGGMLLFLSLSLPEFVLPAGAVPIARPAVNLSGLVELGQDVMPAAHRRYVRRGYGHHGYGRRHYRGYGYGYGGYPSDIYLNFGLAPGYYGGYGGYSDPYYGSGYRRGSTHWCRDRYGRNRMSTDLDVSDNAYQSQCRY